MCRTKIKKTGNNKGQNYKGRSQKPQVQIRVDNTKPEWFSVASTARDKDILRRKVCDSLRLRIKIICQCDDLVCKLKVIGTVHIQ